MMFFEHARQQSEREHAANPTDASVLTRWGGALLELAHFRQGSDAVGLIEEAASKFEHALRLDESRHEAQWCLGNAHTSKGFLTADSAEALKLFEKAGECFKAAADAQPENETYKRSLEMSSKAPALYAELQRQLAAASQAQQAQRAARSKAAGADEAASPLGLRGLSDRWYDLAGWGLLVAIGFGVAAISRAAAASAPAQA